ncbi:RHS repeat-associated core domain-containing protein [Streptomyces tropicalis]|uniref:RHS repeat-associated core domain-containing protein n=1 Tax=Streptomyces tropicalis TaxID=3034234 RepID=A0ABT6A622_9ACTN|nr:RHS repeat-associated core domain-containing protein [Streptomyces tropicalis]MDF3300084.1 RHS repeat-associated core domain-containing protein [Streptomyces tropicalis]
MGYTIPGWLDEVLDFIGIKFPNVDEDDYRDMAEAMRDFADKFEGHGADAHKAVSRILASSQGWAVDAMEKHWNQVKASHLEKLPELARLFADACDALAEIIFWMKTKAEAELAAMAASVGLSIGLAWVTGGLSAVLGAAEIAAMRQAVKRILDAAVDRIVDEVIAKVTEPVDAKLEAMVQDMVLDLVDGAFSMPPAHSSGGHAGKAGGHGGMHLASAGDAGGSSIGAGTITRIDHVELENGAGRVSKHGSEMHLAAGSPLRRARGAFGRSKGRDPFTRLFDSVLHGALKGSEKALKKIATHITDTVPERVRATSLLHKHTDIDISNKVKNVHLNRAETGADSRGPGGILASGLKRGDGLKINSSRLSKQAHALNSREWCGDPIDMASGQMMLAYTDADMPGVLPLTLRRTHLTGYEAGRFFGPSWASTLDERIEENHELGGLWWYREDGSILVYPRRPDLPGDRVQPAAGFPLPLTYITRDTSYVLTVADPYTGLLRHFEPAASQSIWWLTALEDRNHNTISIDRGEDGTPLAVTHTGGYHVDVTADTLGGQRRVTALHIPTDDRPVTMRVFAYDGTGTDLVEVRNAVDAPLHLTYDNSHRVTGWRDSNGTAFAYEYDVQGRVTATHGTDGILNSNLAYTGPDDHGVTRTTYTDALGHATVYRANRKGQVISVTDPLGATVSQEWDHHDHLLSRTDALGRTTHWEWNDSGDLVSTTSPDGTVSRTEYNDLHLPTHWTGPDGTRIRQEFDARGNRTAVHGPDGAITRFTQHPTGAPATLTDALGAQVHMEADHAGLLTAVEDSRGARTTCQRDSFGRPTLLTDALGATTRLVWDSESRLLERVAADGARESWTWDGENNCLSHTDQVGGRNEFTYGPFDLLHTRTTPDGAVYTFAHDTEMRLTTVTDPAGLTWSYHYDERGALVAETDFDDRTTTSSYDAAGQLTARHTPAGATFAFEYDAVGDLRAKEANGARTEYTYDRAGRLATATSATSQVSLEYDPAGRTLAETVDGRTTRYRYDAVGRRTTRTTPTGAITESFWDSAGNCTSLTVQDAHRLAFDYDLLGRETRRTWGEQASLTSDWDAIGRMTGQTLTLARNRPHEKEFTYRPDGHLTSVTDHATGRQLSYELDPLGRPLGVTTRRGTIETYRYDRAGNQATATWTAGSAPSAAAGSRLLEGTRIQSAGRLSYRYDSAGRLIERSRKRLSRKPDTWRYSWDEENRLTSCTTPDGNVWHYRYDALGRRTAKHRTADDGITPVEETLFSWDGTRLAEQHDTATGTTLTWDYDGYRPLAQYERKQLSPDETDARFFAIVTDLVGTPTDLVDEDTVAWHTRTTAWGTTAWNTDATAYTPLRFPGQYADPETSLHYNYFRHYDPETARYTSPDPLGLAPAPNPLTYVTNPQSEIDPLGLARCNEQEVTWGGRVHYGPLGPGNRATGIRATLEPDMMGGKTRPRVNVPGYQRGGAWNKGHLLGAQLGGSNRDPRNFVAMHAYANSPVMRQVENDVRAAVDAGETITYHVTPIYRTNHPSDVVPVGVTLEAHGNRGFQFTPLGSSTSTNAVTILNEPRPEER